MSQENVEIVRRASTAFNRGRRRCRSGAVDPGRRVHPRRSPMAPRQRVYRGHDGDPRTTLDEPSSTRSESARRRGIFEVGRIRSIVVTRSVADAAAEWSSWSELGCVSTFGTGKARA